MKKLQTLARFWLPVICWAGIIFLFSNFPIYKASPIDWQDFLIKKTIHLIEYGILFTLVYRALKNTLRLQLMKVVILAMALVIFYAVTDEFHQTFIFGREGTARDVIIDGLGAALAWGAIWKYLPKAPKKLKNWAKNWQLI